MLNYNNSIPLHTQLKEELELKINKLEYTEKIPSERELMDEYYVSRSTVRQAVGQLVQEGILEKKPGRGTFIVTKTIEDLLGNLSSTTETIERMGMKPGTRLLSVEKLDEKTINNKLIRSLASQSGKVLKIKRLRFADDIPMGIETSYYSENIGEKLIKYDLDKETLYDLIENKIGLKIVRAEQIIKAKKLGKSDSSLLRINSGSAVLVAERKLYSNEDELIEIEHAQYRSDFYSFKMNLSRKK